MESRRFLHLNLLLIYVKIESLIVSNFYTPYHMKEYITTVPIFNNVEKPVIEP